MRGAGNGLVESRPVRCPSKLMESSETMWDVLRWFAVFVIAILVIVAGLFVIMGRQLPIPNF